MKEKTSTALECCDGHLQFELSKKSPLFTSVNSVGKVSYREPEITCSNPRLNKPSTAHQVSESLPIIMQWASATKTPNTTTLFKSATEKMKQNTIARWNRCHQWIEELSQTTRRWNRRGRRKTTHIPSKYYRWILFAKDFCVSKFQIY